ncbi:MAG: hypothetical protein IPK06_04465 [Ignavibacteriae bacterium]|nr:hypothetical protein [Ignavibacteriota bacterium]
MNLEEIDKYWESLTASEKLSIRAEMYGVDRDLLAKQDRIYEESSKYFKLPISEMAEFYYQMGLQF